MQRKPTTAHRPPAPWRRRIQRQLLAWYRRNARDLPWRRTNDPYAIWVSEIMLQQTQVATVERYFPRFLAEFPTPAALAAAEEHDVLRLWEGLGYYRRARQMHATAKIIVAEHQSKFPCDPDIVRGMPGIGRYTAGAILSIAFDAAPADLGGKHHSVAEQAVGISRRHRHQRRAATPLGHGRVALAPARQRHDESGADGTGQPDLHPAKSALRGLPVANALPYPAARIAGTDSCPAATTENGKHSRSGRGN